VAPKRLVTSGHDCQAWHLRCLRLTRIYLIPVLVAWLGAAGALVACGESEEEKAQNEVCDARADIQRRVDDLADLTITTASIERVTNNLEAIRDDLETIAAEQGNLEPGRRQRVEEAGRRFRSQLQATAQDVVAGAASGEEAGARIGSALDELAESFREAYAPVDCD
jgi:aspartate oxidase